MICPINEILTVMIERIVQESQIDDWERQRQRYWHEIGIFMFNYSRQALKDGRQPLVARKDGH